MKKAGLIGIIILLTGVITFLLLCHRPSQNVQLVKFQGVEEVTNLTKGYFDWQSTLDEGDKMNAIPAQENDLIYCLTSGSNGVPLIIQNRNQNGKVLNIKSDSLGAYIDDRLATLSMDGNENNISNWLNHAAQKDMRSLQSVFISDSLTQNAIQQLKTIGKSTSGIGLIIDSQSNDLYELQEALKPSWLWISSAKISAKAADYWNRMDQLEYLILTDANGKQVKFDGLKKLRMLHIDNPDSSTLKQLSSLPKGLTTLQISNSDIRDLGFLDGNKHLKELSINHCSLLQDIRSLEMLPHLTSLSLAHCDSIADLKPLNGLKELRWFAPPGNISEAQLASILSASPNMEALVLLDCKNIKSLHLLKDSHKLSFLTLVSMPVAPDSITRFKNLKYLAYGAGNSNDSLSIARLRKVMPNTLITVAEPFCLGSAWLIVFFILLILLAILAIKIKSRIRV